MRLKSKQEDPSTATAAGLRVTGRVAIVIFPWSPPGEARNSFAADPVPSGCSSSAQVVEKQGQDQEAAVDAPSHISVLLLTVILL